MYSTKDGHGRSSRESSGRLRDVAASLCLLGVVSCAKETSESELTVLALTLDADVSLATGAGTYWTSVLVELHNGSSDDLPLAFAAFRMTGDGGISHDASVASETFDDACRTGTYVTGGATSSCRLAFALMDDELPASISYRDFDGEPHLTVDVEICPADRPDLCGFECVDLATDLDNCGACGAEAEADCVEGVPVCGDLTECEGHCVDLTSDPLHCGACGRSVPANGRCTGGEVACDDGYEYCGDEGCRDLASDSDHCGACGEPVIGDETVCSDGESVCTDPVEMLCGELCTDISADRYNCGGCGLECPIPEDAPLSTRFVCESTETCTISLLTPGGACDDVCGAADWTCEYEGGGGVCICGEEYSAGECLCRCRAPLI